MKQFHIGVVVVFVMIVIKKFGQLGIICIGDGLTVLMLVVLNVFIRWILLQQQPVLLVLLPYFGQGQS